MKRSSQRATRTKACSATKWKLIEVTFSVSRFIVPAFLSEITVTFFCDRYDAVLMNSQQTSPTTF